MHGPDYSVATLGELVTLPCADFAEGANVWVATDLAYWTLEKNSGAALGPTVLAPITGAPAAGAANARWIREAGVASVSNWIQSVDAELAADKETAGAAVLTVLSATIAKASGVSKLICRAEATGLVVHGTGTGVGNVGIRIDGGAIKYVQVFSDPAASGLDFWSTSISEVFTGLPAGNHTVDLVAVVGSGLDGLAIDALANVGQAAAHIDIFEVLT